MKILYPNLYIEKQVKSLEDVRGIKVGIFFTDRYWQLDFPDIRAGEFI